MFTNPPSVISTAPSIQYFKQNSEDPLLRVSRDLHPVYLPLQLFKERERREVGGVAGSQSFRFSVCSQTCCENEKGALRCPRSVLCRHFRRGSNNLSLRDYLHSQFLNFHHFLLFCFFNQHVFQQKTLFSTNILGASLLCLDFLLSQIMLF